MEFSQISRKLIFGVGSFIVNEPNHDKVFDTHAHDYNARHVKHAVSLFASSI